MLLGPASPADCIEQHTRDFVTRTLLTELSHRDFEEFTADLLKALGYQTRATPYTSDGGIDVTAHRDPLGTGAALHQGAVQAHVR